MKYYSLREFEENGKVELEYILSVDNEVDIFTKHLPENEFEALKDLLYVSSKIPKE